MTAIAQVLLAHPEARVTRSYREALEPHGFAVTVAADGPTAVSMMALRRYELVLMALWLPGCDVPGLVQELRQGEASPEVMIIDDDVFSEPVVEILRLGAYDVVSAETSSSELVLRSERAVSSQRRDRELWLLKREAERAPFAGPVIQASGKIQSVLRKLMTVAPARASVLLLGETGTGKGLMAKTLHRYSGRDPFLAVNCGGFQEALFESELFGHRRGAFTGAVDHKPGLFEAAHGGTLFLDEIAELQPSLQAKLLQVLDSGEIRPVGSTASRKVEVRLVAATNADLEDLVAAGRFRQDLYFRLNVVAIRMPPLRERPEDIPLLLQHYLDRFQVPGSPRKRFSSEALDRLESYGWPGNVRELANVVETASLLTAGSVIELDDLPLAPKALATPTRSRTADLPLPLYEVERRHILAMLEHTRGHRGRAAHLLGIDVKTLARKLRAYNSQERRPGELPGRRRDDPAN